MKKVLFVALLFLIYQSADAQENDQKIALAFSGFISNDLCFTTRQTLTARGEGQFILAPLPIIRDQDGKDINSAASFNIVGLASRLRTKIVGPDAFGAKTTGMVEGDFLGITKESKFNFRLRHAYVNLDWGKTQLLVGQYWHPTFIVECFPGTVSFGAGSPFNPLARNPQFKYSFSNGKMKLSATALANGHFLNKGAPGAQMTAMLPELNVKAQFRFERGLAGFGFGYKVLRPELVSETNYVTDAKVNSATVFGYVKMALPQLVLKGYTMYGQNNDNAVMMGGYAVVDKTYTAVELSKGLLSYTPYSTLTSWLDIHSSGKNIVVGLFAGYSENLGASENVKIDTFVGRWSNVQSMFRVAPRLVFISGKTKIGTEIEYSSVNYHRENSINNSTDDFPGYNSKGVVVNHETANNVKFLLNISYHF